ncbi:MAG: PilN domain-containing protein [Actinomycetota bacterium]
MMRRIELLPTRYAERRRQRQTVGVIVGVGVVAVVLLVAWWFLLETQISDERDELAQVRAQNQQLQAQIDELARFAELDREVRDKETALQTVMVGDVDWPRLMTELAMVVPGEVWLQNLSASAAVLEGATAVGTETAVVRISPNTPFGRVQFTGNSLTMPGVAKWLIRLASVRQFEAIWLNNASRPEEEGTTVPVVDFDNTIELNRKAASERFQGGIE